MYLVRVLPGCAITCTGRPNSNSYSLFLDYIWSSRINLITNFRQLYCFKQCLLTLPTYVRTAFRFHQSTLSNTTLALTAARDLISHRQRIKSAVCNIKRSIRIDQTCSEPRQSDPQAARRSLKPLPRGRDCWCHAPGTWVLLVVT